jgi:hypothetical protein
MWQSVGFNMIGIEEKGGKRASEGGAVGELAIAHRHIHPRGNWTLCNKAIFEKLVPLAITLAQGTPLWWSSRKIRVPQPISKS